MTNEDFLGVFAGALAWAPRNSNIFTYRQSFEDELEVVVLHVRDAVQVEVAVELLEDSDQSLELIKVESGVGALCEPELQRRRAGPVPALQPKVTAVRFMQSMGVFSKGETHD